MIDIRKEASKIVGFRIEKDDWDKGFSILDVNGKLTMRIMFQLVILILKKLDEYAQ